VFDTRAQRPEQLNFENMIEGQVGLQLAGIENSELSGSIIKMEVVVADVM
jgi:hypothetical protein